MQKTCRTCGADRIWGRCDIGFSEKNRSCWIPPKTPPLVDVLAEALCWLLNLHHGVSKGGTRYEMVGREWDEALQAGIQALARHQKETGDVPKD